MSEEGARRVRLSKRALCAAVSLAALLCAAPAFASSCEDLVSLKLTDTAIETAQSIPAGDYTTPFKAITAKHQVEHPVLKGVGTITSRGYYNNGKLAEDAVVLQVVESEKKTPLPVTWTHTYKGGRTIYTSMGAPEDFKDENFRRLLVNAIFWTAQRDPEKMKK